ncbi:MAG: DUF3800 domain-containing protein [Methanocellales archaeon]|nr:DUF3800 domain-containing protein [Methanocellales archaeon]MDD3291915.1 DUF3800 domain-containing protein [Methanocellales archaeon]MDD5235774.1 DUF3800 domain-containing protein [Methanocellales archaeon]MDD5485531.1 DUF3800 domain-containing protein [Methanocellales archaeon]
MCFIFIDESGDLGMKGSNYMVIAALFVKDYRPLDRIIKNMRRYKFRKELKNVCEIKTNKSSDAVRKHMLKKLNNIPNARIFYIVLEKKKLYSDYLKDNKDKLYNYVAGKLAKNIIILEDTQLEIKIDKSKGKHLLREDFNRYFLQNLCEGSDHMRVTIDHSYSHSWSGIQFADLLAWCCFQKFEHGNSEYIDIITQDQEVYHVW